MCGKKKACTNRLSCQYLYYFPFAADNIKQIYTVDMWNSFPLHFIGYGSAGLAKPREFNHIRNGLNNDT